MTDATRRFFAYLNSDSTLRVAYEGMLTDIGNDYLLQLCEVPNWDTTCFLKGALSCLKHLRALPEKEIRDATRRQDYDRRAGRE